MKKTFLFLVGIFALTSDLFQVKHNAAAQAKGMALIKLSSIGITNLSGKAGGSVYSRNRGGAYIKNFVMPVNTFSEARQLVRASFGAISSAWRSLTQPQRNSFTEQAPNYPTINTLGDTNVLSGNSLYVMLNKNLVNTGLPKIDVAIAPQGTNALLGDADVPTFVLGVGGNFTFDIGMSGDNAIELNHYVLEATPAVSKSITNVNNRFRMLASTAIAPGSIELGTRIGFDSFNPAPSGLRDAYISKFGTPSEGSVVWFRIKAINPRTGESSAYFTQTAIVS